MTYLPTKWGAVQNPRVVKITGKKWCFLSFGVCKKKFGCLGLSFARKGLPFRSINSRALEVWGKIRKFVLVDVWWSIVWVPWSWGTNIPYIDDVIFFVRDGFVKAHEFLSLKFLTYLFLYHQKLFLTCSMGLEHFTCGFLPCHMTSPPKLYSLVRDLLYFRKSRVVKYDAI